MQDFNTKDIKDNNQSYSEDIDLKSTYNFFLRNKYFIGIFTSLLTIGSVYISSLSEKIYKGRFQIVVDSTSVKKTNNSSETNILQSLIGGTSVKDNKTQEFILKSPYVLKPVFNYAKEEYRKRGEDVNGLKYESWINNNLQIKFEEGTNILKIELIDKDKEFILKTLDVISKKYQNYSKKDIQKKLSKEKSYLEEQQKIYKAKSLSSLKKLNTFSINNGLGNIDGFVSLGKSPVGEFSLQNIPRANGLITDFQNSISTNKETNAGQRFSTQLNLLERYESQYVNLSSVLKPESNYMTDLKTKIDNLKSALKRPNEILIKYKELNKEAERDEYFLNNIEMSLGMVNLEIAKQLNPWLLISLPTIDAGVVAPRPKRNGFYTFILAFSAISLISKLKEKLSGFIYEFVDFENLIDFPYLETIYQSNKDLSISILKKVLNEIVKNKKDKKIGFIKFNKNNNFINELILETDNKEVNIEDSEDVCNYDFLVFIACEGKTTTKEITRLNKYKSIYQEKIIGWFYFNDKTKL